MLSKIMLYLRKPEKIIAALGSRDLLNFLDDKIYLEHLYEATLGKKLNIEKPKTFNEKLQWLKLYDRKPEYTQLVDKYKVREYVRDSIGSEHLIPLLAVVNEFEQINFEKLPAQFVIKTTHDSGGVVVCRDKGSINLQNAKYKINKSLKNNYYYRAREWPYKDVKPRIIIEELLTDKSGRSLNDYKILCFNGEPKIIQVMSDRTENDFYLNHYDIEWNEIDIQRKNRQKNPKPIEKPKRLNEILAISRILSRNIPFVRVDLYYTNNHIYFGELTFYPMSGFMDFADSKSDNLLGSWIELPY